MKCALPLRRFNQHRWNTKARDDGLDRAGCPAVLERTCDAVTGPRTGAFYAGEIGMVALNPVAQTDRIDARLCRGAENRNIDDVDEFGAMLSMPSRISMTATAPAMPGSMPMIFMCHPH